MRGPRAFIALTLYLALLAGFTVMIYLLAAQSAASQAAFGGGNPYASASVGQAVFTVLLFLQILLVVFLAPGGDGGGDQPRAREADARPADGHADQHPRDRARQARLGARLRRRADPGLDPPDRRRVRVRGRRPRGRRPRLRGPARHRARVRIRRDPPVQRHPAHPERHGPHLPRGPGADRRHGLCLVLLGPDGGDRAGGPALRPRPAGQRWRWRCGQRGRPAVRIRARTDGDAHAAAPARGPPLAQPGRRGRGRRVRHGREPLLDGLPADQRGHRHGPGRRPDPDRRPGPDAGQARDRRSAAASRRPM